MPQRTSKVWDRIEIENRSFVKTAESYKASFVTINRQTLYDWCPSSRLRNHTRFADWVTMWVVHLPERIETGLCSASDQFTETDRNGPNYRIGVLPCIAAIAGS